MSNKPILFFSRRNQDCINLWEKLSKENRLNSFVKICVDNNNKIPASIKTVPTIFVKGRPLIYGPAINMYLSSLQSPGSSSQPRTNNPARTPTTFIILPYILVLKYFFTFNYAVSKRYLKDLYFKKRYLQDLYT